MVRLITALFWHSITNFLGVGPTIQVIRAIWPSFRTMTNHLPESAGITSQQMIAYFVLWVVQFPILLIPPHKMRWLFTVKIVMAMTTIVGMTIWICVKAGGSGDIWNQQPAVSGSAKSWLIMWSLNSCTASWSTVGVNIPDFTRYLRKPRSALEQAVWFPLICSWVAIIGIIVTSASYVLYSEYLWDPIAIIDTWDGPGGRAAAFFAGLSWVLAQICVNVSATVISGANDLANLFPKWFNIRRGAIFITIIGGWAMVPWKILHSASSLLSFMGSLAIFLSPMMVSPLSLFSPQRQLANVPPTDQNMTAGHPDRRFLRRQETKTGLTGPVPTARPIPIYLRGELAGVARAARGHHPMPARPGIQRQPGRRDRRSGVPDPVQLVLRLRRLLPLLQPRQPVIPGHGDARALHD